MKRWISLLFVGALASCATSPTGAGQLSPDVTRRWNDDHSYYALVEIIDAHFADRPAAHRATRAELLTYLGPPNWGTINQSPQKQWAYQGSGRHVPYGDKVIFTFNDRDEIIGIDWVSE